MTLGVAVAKIFDSEGALHVLKRFSRSVLHRRVIGLMTDFKIEMALFAE